MGDEGSGASLGKALLSDVVKGMLPEDMEASFSARYGLDYPAIVRKVYRESGASAFLGSFAPFILENISHPYMRTLVTSCMDAFMQRSLSRYKPGETVKVGVVGSLGCACEDILREEGRRYGLEFVKFMKSPIDELVKYHGI